MKTTTKENLTVKELHDRDGHSETIILDESEILKLVENWLKENNFADLMKNEGIFRQSQSYGNRVDVYIDARSGKIDVRTTEQNTISSLEPFFITLASHDEVDEDAQCICDGADMTVEATGSEIMKAFEMELEDLELEKVDIGKYKICWWDNQDYITAESFVEKLMNEDWSEWVDNYADYLLEDIENQNPSWHENVKDYYNLLRDEKEYRSL
jgi:hypothetical protein